jgi:hypothetical protein
MPEEPLRRCVTRMPLGDGGREGGPSRARGRFRRRSTRLGFARGPAALIVGRPSATYASPMRRRCRPFKRSEEGGRAAVRLLTGLDQACISKIYGLAQGTRQATEPADGGHSKFQQVRRPTLH